MCDKQAQLIHKKIAWKLPPQKIPEVLGNLCKPEIQDTELCKLTSEQEVGANSKI